MSLLFPLHVLQFGVARCIGVSFSIVLTSPQSLYFYSATQVIDAFRIFHNGWRADVFLIFLRVGCNNYSSSSYTDIRNFVYFETCIFNCKESSKCYIF